MGQEDVVDHEGHLTLDPTDPQCLHSSSNSTSLVASLREKTVMVMAMVVLGEAGPSEDEVGHVEGLHAVDLQDVVAHLVQVVEALLKNPLEVSQTLALKEMSMKVALTSLTHLLTMTLDLLLRASLEAPPTIQSLVG